MNFSDKFKTRIVAYSDGMADFLLAKDKGKAEERLRDAKVSESNSSSYSIPYFLGKFTMAAPALIGAVSAASGDPSGYLVVSSYLVVIASGLCGRNRDLKVSCPAESTPSEADQTGQ